ARLDCLLFALRRESAPFLRRFLKRRIRNAPTPAWELDNLLVVETGMGVERSLAAMRWIVEHHAPEVVISAGFAGALEDGWRVGDVLVAREVIDTQARTWAASPDGHGRLLTVQRMVGDPEEKRRLGQQHQAAAVDMESAAVAQFCSERGLSFLSVRAISDDVAARLSPELLRLLGGSTVALMPLLAALFRRPG